MIQRRHFVMTGTAGLGTAWLSGCAAGPSIRDVQTAQPIATVSDGELKGRNDGKVLSFLGVPYAANPFTAGRRFRAPEPMEPWKGVRDAQNPRPMPPQPSRNPGGGVAGDIDDLTLNIWAPVGARGAPVMVWLPGGAFYRVDATEGWYDGSSFAQQGVIVVTVNYRVGIDGFMAVEGAPHNRGFLDQLAALRWVKRNIAAFGGDPDKVTLAGQSTGAQSVLALMGMPSAQGLFQRAIAQSPPVNHHTLEQARAIAAATASYLKVPQTAAGLAAVPMADTVRATESMISDLRTPGKWGALEGQPPFLPVVDGQVVTDSPVAALRRHSSRQMPLLMGCTDEEARLYLLPGGIIDRIPAPAVAGLLRRLGLPPQALATYAKVRPQASAGDMLAALESDMTFRIPTLRYAEARAQMGAPLWVYHFAWSSPAFGGRLGAAHVLDVPYVFNTLATAQAKPFLGGSGSQPLAQEMHACWAAFVKGQDPTWPRYDLVQRPTMRFDVESQVVNDPLAERRLLWADKLGA